MGDRQAPKSSRPRAPLSRGAKGEDVLALVDFLTRYGYLGRADRLNDDIFLSSPSASDREFDVEVERAVILFQKSYGLEVTGALDLSMLEIMQLPRCGLPDFGETSFLQAVVATVWDHSPLTYTFENFCERLGEALTVTIIENALSYWAAACTLGFVRLEAQTADLSFSWVSGNHGDGKPEFTFPANPGQDFGHAFFPGTPLAGRVHFNAREIWSNDDPASGSADLLTVATHEIGHALGIRNHLNAARGNVMNGVFSWGLVRRNLTPADIEAIQALYGPP